MAGIPTNLSRKDTQALDVARLYYEAHLTQAQIGERMHLARPTVSKLLTHAHRRGFVHIEVRDPREHDELVIRHLTERYDLDEVRLLATTHHLPGQMRLALAAQGADLLSSLVRDGDVIAAQTSQLLGDIARALPATKSRSIRLLQMCRSLAEVASGREDTAALSLAAGALGGTAHAQALPLLAESVHEANLLRAAPQAAELLTELSTARIAVFTATPFSRLLPLLERLDLTEAETRTLQRHAVGELCSHLIDSEGSICLPDLNNRTLGISLSDLRHLKHKVLVAAGRDCAPVVRAALNAGYVNRLVTDVDTARGVLRLDS